MKPKTIADNLRTALEVTQTALAADSRHAAEVAVALRAPLLERASDARSAGEPWGKMEAHLVEQLMEADVQLIQMLWRPNAEAFDWLAGRDETKVADLPHLRQLSGR